MSAYVGMYPRAQWGTRLAHKLNMIHSEKFKKLTEVTFAARHANFNAHKDTVLDPIKSIEVLRAEEHSAHPKLYDVTVPSTLNFTLANGLGARDTSETGYLQRKLVKAMEDCKVQHDLSVRNAAGQIVQFLYGEDGMDAIKLEYQKLPYLTSRKRWTCRHACGAPCGLTSGCSSRSSVRTLPCNDTRPAPG